MIEFIARNIDLDFVIEFVVRLGALRPVLRPLCAEHLGKSGLSKSAFTRCRRSTSSMWVLLRASYCRRYADPISGASRSLAAQIRILSRLNVAVRMCAVAPVFFTRRTFAHPLKGEEAECILCLTNGAYFSVSFTTTGESHRTPRDGGPLEDSSTKR